MKTLVVLCALASIVLAAPAQQGAGLEKTHRVPDWYGHRSFPETTKRETKSPSDLLPPTDLHTTHALNSDIQVGAGASPLMGRSFAAKKPVIVKKKFGYRLYRDSDEEKANADSQESCGRQVKVKLCDEEGKFRDMLKKSGHELINAQSNEDDMKHSIKMAKEAVENLQRDLKKMEQKSNAMKDAHESQSDADLHKDIEVAREALEHIHMNFGNLDTMSLHATASRDSETTHDVHVTIARSEEEKMAQWKEAMDNIKRNVDIVRNIEDSFKAADFEQKLLHLDQVELDSAKHEQKMEEDIAAHAASNEDRNMRNVESALLDTQSKPLEKDDVHLPSVLIDQLSDTHTRHEQHEEDEMKTSASEALEMKTVDIHSHDVLHSENHQHHEHHGHQEHEMRADTQFENHSKDFHNQAIENMDNMENIPEHHLIHQHQQIAKSSESEQQIAAVDFEKHQQSLSMNDAEQEQPLNLGGNLDLLRFKASENTADVHVAPTDSVRVLSPTVFTEQQRNTEVKQSDDKTKHSQNHEKTFVKTKDLTGFQAKSVSFIDTKKGKHEESNLHLETEKAAETLKPSLEENHHFTQHLDHQFEVKPKDAIQSPLIQTENKEKKEHVLGSLQETQLHKFDNIAEQNENFMRTADHTVKEQNEHHKIDYSESEHMTPLNKMKSTEDHLSHLTNSKLENERLHRFHYIDPFPHNAQLVHENRHLPSVKATADFETDLHGIDHMEDPHHPEAHFIAKNTGATHEFDMSQHDHIQVHTHAPTHNHGQVQHHAHGHMRHPHHHMSHTHMHEMPHGMMPSNYHSNMREAMEGLGSEHTFRWQPTHESSRNAYGAGLSSSISLGSSSGGSSGGAVGVFPNANTGGCGIPLLLSCSPSVVSGSLAKAHAAGSAAYSSPSYRNEEDLSFHNKRDVKMMNEIRSTNALRTPALTKQKGKTLETQL